MSDLHSKLVLKKLDEICYNLATYFNYLIIPRPGYFIIGSNNIDIKPVINYMHIIYLLNEIYPCSDFNSMLCGKNPLPYEIIKTNKGDKTKIILPEKFRKNTRENIKKYIDINCLDKVDDQIFKLSLTEYQSIDINNIEITGEVIEKIYHFWITYKLVFPEKEDEIKSYQLSLLNKRSTQKYGFNSEIEDTAFQSIIYVITSLVDSLDLKTVGINEVETSLKLLIPQDLQESFKLVPQDDKSTRKIINDAFNSKGLTIDIVALQLLTDYMQKVNKIQENVYSYKNINPFTPNARILNRLMGFSSYV